MVRFISYFLAKLKLPFDQAKDYWMYKYRDVNNQTNTSQLSPLQLQWNSYLSMSTMIPNLLVVLMNAAVGHKFPLAPRLIIGQLAIIVIFAITDAMTFVNTDALQMEFLIGTLTSVVVISSMVGLVQGGLAALAAYFPPKYMGIMMQGQAVGGVVVAVINTLTIAVGSSSVYSASWSFLIGSVFTLSSLLLYIVATRFDFYKVRRSEFQQPSV